LLRYESRRGCRRQRPRHSGQTTVLLAILLPSLVGSVALGVDVSVFYFNWSQLQAAADSAALAGAAYLPSSPTKAVDVASEYAELNGVSGSEIVTNAVAADNQSITVECSRDVPYYFAKVLGLATGTVATRAIAAIRTAGSVRGIVPIGIAADTNYTYGQPIQLISGVGPGNWQPLALGGTGAATYTNNIINGYQESIAVGDWLATEPGVMVGPTKTGFNARITAGLAEYPGGTFDNHELDDPRVVVVPMVDFSGIEGRSDVPVMGFAVLWIVSVSGNGQIQAYFIEQTVSGAEPGDGASNFGAYRAVLVE
jgi:Flp pilus assembly protein TadG